MTEKIVATTPTATSTVTTIVAVPTATAVATTTNAIPTTISAVPGRSEQKKE